MNQLFKHQSGFTMIEILVTVFVLAVGVLGLMGMQAIGLQNNHSAYVKSQVISSINEMVDRMRANEVGLNGNRYASVDTSTLANPGYDCTNVFTGTTSGTECNDQEIALSDIYTWGKGLSAMLPSGYGTVTCNDSPCVNGSNHTITVFWDDNRDGSANSSFSIVTAL